MDKIKVDYDDSVDRKKIKLTDDEDTKSKSRKRRYVISDSSDDDDLLFNPSNANVSTPNKKGKICFKSAENLFDCSIYDPEISSIREIPSLINDLSDGDVSIEKRSPDDNYEGSATKNYNVTDTESNNECCDSDDVAVETSTYQPQHATIQSNPKSRTEQRGYPITKFLTISETMNVFNNISDKSIVNEIVPDGKKENIYFILSENKKGASQGKVACILITVEFETQRKGKLQILITSSERMTDLNMSL